MMSIAARSCSCEALSVGSGCAKSLRRLIAFSVCAATLTSACLYRLCTAAVWCLAGCSAMVPTAFASAACSANALHLTASSQEDSLSSSCKEHSSLCSCKASASAAQSVFVSGDRAGDSAGGEEGGQAWGSVLVRLGLCCVFCWSSLLQTLLKYCRSLTAILKSSSACSASERTGLVLLPSSSSASGGLGSLSSATLRFCRVKWSWGARSRGSVGSGWFGWCIFVWGATESRCDLSCDGY